MNKTSKLIRACCMITILVLMFNCKKVTNSENHVNVDLSRAQIAARPLNDYNEPMMLTVDGDGVVEVVDEQRPPSSSHSTPPSLDGDSGASSRLNQTHGSHFKAWIDAKSNELFELTRNYSGFQLLNHTYNTRLTLDAKFSWINFTEMIMNISNSISEVLYNKTVVVKNLSDLVEKSFNEYANDSNRVVNSTMHVYYDAKSPYTFCDVAESYKNRGKNKQDTSTTTTNPITTTTTTTTTTTSTSSSTQNAARIKKKVHKRNVDNYHLYNANLQFTLNPYHKFKSDVSVINMTDLAYFNSIHDRLPPSTGAADQTTWHKSSSATRPRENHQHRNNHKTLVSVVNKNQQVHVNKTSTNKTSSGGGGKSRKQTTSKGTTSLPTTTAEPDVSSEEDEDSESDQEEELDDTEEIDETNFEFEDDYWEVDCINRTYDENFKSLQKVNRNESTIQVPVNVYKQDVAINMTAYWTEALDEQFKSNYDTDNELFWQFFCSSNGLFRRYPAAYWSVPPNVDFFDCRLQSWYIMAAASPKDVIILLDVSGSMTGLRLEIGKKLIEFILDTLSDNDFFNVLTFSKKEHFLFDENDSKYKGIFVQAGKENKMAFKKRLEEFKSTSQQAKLENPLRTVFKLFNENLTRSNCNKIIMIITDGHADNVDPVFEEFNSEKRIRVFSFKIGRDMTDPSIIKQLACKNNGEYYHVVTLTDINEHVYEYISVLSRPMALNNVRETAWSNVFIGYLDKELKIAVARPAFRDVVYNYSNYELTRYMNKTIDFKVENYEQILKKKKNQHNLYVTTKWEQNLISNAEKEIRKQHVLLGVVGVDVPVLRLISKVSPKYQMGVGIYIIMLDNNGFIVFHPSIKKEISNSQFDNKGTSSSIDLDRFEIPIHNENDFEELEHEMIDQKTGNRTLNNWKREGLRVIPRRTEYVYTTVSRTPFSVAIASPSSFGRYYIDIPSEKEAGYERDILKLVKKRFDSNIQLYNCSYSFQRLADRILSPKASFSDYCIKYLYMDHDQALAIKSDLVLHDSYYYGYNFSMFYDHPNLIRSSFYGTYSGITFYIPVTLFKLKQPAQHSSSSSASPGPGGPSASTDEYYHVYAPNETNITVVEPTIDQSIPLDMLEAYNQSLNLLSTESNKHTFSFEKQYYTRTIEFSDYLRTEFKRRDEPMAIYFLNESSKETLSETLSAAMPIWLDKVPTAVSGVVYDANRLKNLLFYSPSNCEGEACSICNSNGHLNVTCYLVDEHGIVVLTTSKQTSMINQPLYKINPWLMLQLEKDGLYNLIVTGNKLKECSKPPMEANGSIRLFNVISFLAKWLYFLLADGVKWAMMALGQAYSSVSGQNEDAIMARNMKLFQIEFRIKNSHCFYFGIYSFNLTKWKTMDPSEVKVWCNSSLAYAETHPFHKPNHYRTYLAGYLKYSNLLMLVVEDESEVTRCGQMETLAKHRPPIWNLKTADHKQHQNNNTSPLSTAVKMASSKSTAKSHMVVKKDYSINRYRKQPEHCYDYFANESKMFFCNSFSITLASGRLLTLVRNFKYSCVFVYSLLLLFLNRFSF